MREAVTARGTVADLAERLDDAMRNATAIAQIDQPLSLEQAYAVQAAAFARRLGRGERRIGIKMGFTSLAKMAQMGISEVIWGRLSDAMLVENGGSISRARYVHPRTEPEIAFRLGADLGGSVTAEEALAAVSGIAPALEIIDSRYENFKFSLTDVVADNSSSSGLVVGNWLSPETDIAAVAMRLEVDGQVREEGTSAAILGNPILSLVEAARLAAAAGEPLRAGEIIMAGGATAAVALAVGAQVRLVAGALGEVQFRVAA